MADEIQKTFHVSVKIVKGVLGTLEDDVNYGRLLKMIEDGIAESCGRTIGVINSYQVGDVEMESDDG